ncbi:MAG: hypothetical protein JJE04_14160 [Acidobacteriia bacterium]|nr:hypothetical protein [Terriglobia bacterium]
MKKMISILALAAVAFAGGAQTHRIKLFQDSIVNGTELKSGDYKVTVEDGRAVLSNGKSKAESAVKVEPAESKFDSTSVRYQNGDGKYRVKEIRLGGTTTKLVFEN